MTVMGPPVVSILPGTSPSDICSDCGLPQDDPTHAAPPTGPGEGPSDGPTGFDEDEPPTGKGGDSEDGEDEDGKGGDEPTDDDPDDDEDDDGPGSGDDDEDEPTDEDGKGGKGTDTDDEPKGPVGPLPDEVTVGAGRGTPVTITDKDRAALQKAVEEDALLEGDAEVGRGQILRDPMLIEGFQRREWRATDALGAATAAIRSAFMKSKSGVEDYEGGLRKGRLNNHSLHRVAVRGEDRLFGQRLTPDVAKYNLWVLVDCSASMAGREIAEASAVAQAFASATATIGTIRTSVWGWTDAFVSNLVQQVHPAFGAVRVYKRGDDPSRCRDLCDVPMGGTPDGPTMAWAIGAIQRESAPGEQPIIAFVSDGMGYQSQMVKLVEAGRKAGVIILGVNISGGAAHTGGPVKDKVYGTDYIPWMGGIVQMASPLARVIARIITPR